MMIILAIIVSAIASTYYDIDFCTIYTFITISLSLSKKWYDYTKDNNTLFKILLLKHYCINVKKHTKNLK